MSEFGSVWKWETPVFEVTVNGDMRSFYWAIADKMEDPTALAKPFADGQAGSFEQAERSIRETIGKAYPPNVGYRHYAGHLATTFSTARGRLIDFGPLENKVITVIVALPDGTDEEYEGIASVHHYELVLTRGGEDIYIMPSHILDVRADRTMTSVAVPAMDSKPMVGRTVKGVVSPGCTGSAGYLPGTVDHSGATCPIHE